jgi:purine-binding chemotaxis protein CheW
LNVAVGNDRVLTFSVGPRAFSLPAARVREVVGRRRLTPVPQAPASLLGLVNIRGAVLPVLSLGALLSEPVGRFGRIIIIDEDNPLGLAVDSVATVTDGIAARSAGVDPIEIGPLVARSFSGLAPRSGRRSAPVRRRRAVVDAERRVQLIAFAIGEQEFALPLDTVEAVIAVPQAIARVPGGEAAVLGTTDWRGALLPLLSLPILLGLPADPTARGRIIVVTIAGARVGLRVDGLRDVLALAPTLLDPLPAALVRGGGEARIQAVARLDDGRRLVSVLAPDELLSPAFLGGLARDARTVAADKQAAAERSEALMLFRLGGERYGLPLTAIDEIARVPEALTSLPRAPAFLRGLMGLRGRALPVVDQAGRFGVAAATSVRAIVARVGALEAAFLVDAIEGVVRVPADRLTPAPALDGEALFDRVLVDGEDGALTLLMSAFALLGGTERAMLDALRVEGDLPQ